MLNFKHSLLISDIITVYKSILKTYDLFNILGNKS